jgi:hypothetical protein
LVATLVCLPRHSEAIVLCCEPTPAPTNFTAQFIAQGRIGNNRMVPGHAYGTREVSLTQDECGWNSVNEIGQYVWTSGVATPFVLTYSAEEGIARFSMGTTTVWHVVETSLNGRVDFLFRLSARRANTSIRLHNVTLNGAPLDIDLFLANSCSDLWAVVTTSVGASNFLLKGLATLCFPSGPGCPNNDQLRFQIFAGAADSGDEPAPEDADGDGLPDAWEIQYFGDIKNCSPSDDSDADGASNIEEYAAETDPTDARSLLTVYVTPAVTTNSPPSRSESPSQAVVVPALQWPSVSNRTYTVLRATTLSHGMAGFSPIAEAIPGAPPYNMLLDPTATGAGPYYYRVRVHRPP